MEQRDFLRKKLMQRTKRKIEEKIAGKEVHIIKAVNLLRDLEAVSNLMRENISEWAKRAPTADAAKMFAQLESNTSGIETERKNLTTFIETEMKKEFPNFSVLATPLIGARLLSQAGAKKDLCMMPASTIQLLGAEKALFNHMKKKGGCPKHGHIFNHPLLQRLPKPKRGKAARIIAGKLSVALKVDYFGGADDSVNMLKDLEEKIRKL